MFGDLFQFGFNFSGGFNFGGGFQGGGFNFGGGFQGGGFNFGGGGFQGGAPPAGGTGGGAAGGGGAGGAATGGGAAGGGAAGGGAAGGGGAQGGGFQGGGFNFGGGFQGGFQGGFNFGGGFQGGFQGGGGGGFQLGGGFGAPVAVARGAFKIAENGTVRPEDRVFVTYNYYDNVLKALSVHREMVGFEKTFFDGAASLEMRLPFIQNDVQNTSERESDIADLSFILKYALVNQQDRVLSVGVATTAPTGPVPSVLIIQPDRFEQVHPWQIQPFVGYYAMFGNWYVQGFSSAMIPTDDRDAVWLFNDVGIGYFLYEGSGMLRSVIPTVEAHVNTPLQNRGDVGFADSIDLTAGSYFQFGERMTLGLAAGTPVTGPKLFAFEAIASLNWRF